MSMNLTDQNKAEIRLIAQEVFKEYSLSFKENNKSLTHEIRELPALIAGQVQKDFHLIDIKLDSIEQKFDARIDAIIAEKDANSKRIEKIEGKYVTKTEINQDC